MIQVHLEESFFSINISEEPKQTNLLLLQSKMEGHVVVCYGLVMTPVICVVLPL